MKFRYRKRAKIIPGVYLNFSKSGISTTIGGRGVSVNIGKRGTYLNLGLPGTGIYARQRIGATTRNSSNFNSRQSTNLKPTPVFNRPYKDRQSVVMLAFFVGGFGAHRFYLDQPWRGIFSLLFCWTLIPTVVSLFDALLFGLMSDEEFDEKYNDRKRYPPCATCGQSLTFMTTPNFGGGKLTDGGRVCRDCFAKIVKTDIYFGLKSAKHYDTHSARQALAGVPADRYASDYVAKQVPTSESLADLKKHIEEVRSNRQDLLTEIEAYKDQLYCLEQSLKNKQTTIRKFFVKQETIQKIESRIAEHKEYLIELEEQYNNSRANISIETTPEIEAQYQQVVQSFVDLTGADKIWDIIAESRSTEEKSSAASVIRRREVLFSFEDIDFIFSDHPALHLENADGDNIYIYPAFVLQMSRKGELALIDLKELHFYDRKQRFLEEPLSIPNDTSIIDYTWERVNKDGSPDRRFKNNRQIPVVEYGVLEFATASGMKETYYISNLKLAKDFANAFKSYLALLRDPIDNMPAQNTLVNSSAKEFTIDQFKLLNELAEKLQKMINNISHDAALQPYLRLNQHETQVSVRFCIIYDLIQIVRLLMQGNMKPESWRMTALALVTSELSSQNGTNSLIKNDYDTILKGKEQGIFLDFTNHLVEISTQANPINIRISRTAKDKDDSAHQQPRYLLALPSVLKLVGSPFFDEYATIVYRFATVIANINSNTLTDDSILKEIYTLTHQPVLDISSYQRSPISQLSEDNSLEDVLEELNSLIGLEAVKAEINTLINFIRVQQAREASGLRSSSLSYHIVFTGNPGTGKTTVARIVAKIYKHLGILKQGHLLETDRSGLIAEYVGQTAVKVNKTIDAALNGVLFIDEAYALANEGQNDYGKEAIATLIKRMEDDRDKLVVILAGYTNEMQQFINMNPGFKSRFNRYVHFPDYTPDELYAIFLRNCEQADYCLTSEAADRLKELLASAYSQRDKTFGNGRYVRNIFEKTLERQANRIAKIPHLTQELLTRIEAEDLPLS